MKDIPIFTTENGVASLTLKEIPYSQTAYIQIQDSMDPAMLLDECVSFCRAVGAEIVLATGNDILEMYPVHTTVIKMQCQIKDLPETDAALFPVQTETFEQWRKIYNDRMKNVHNAAFLSAMERDRFLKSHNCYFVHREDVLLGMGAVADNQIEVVASVVPGSGADVMLALCNAVFSDVVSLEVASNNLKALNLYNRLGFIPIAEVSKWYRIY